MKDALFAIAQLRHLYTQLLANVIGSQPAAANNLLSPAIQMLETEFSVRESATAKLDVCTRELNEAKQALVMLEQKAEAYPHLPECNETGCIAGCAASGECCNRMGAEVNRLRFQLNLYAGKLFDIADMLIDLRPAIEAEITK